MSNRKDTDFLYISTMVRAKENQLLTTDQVARMIDAKSDEEALRVLEEVGYENLSGLDSVALERQLSRRVDSIFQELVSRAPDPGMVDIFRIKYDYHNAKVLIKAEAAGTDAGRLLSGSGRIAPKELADRYYQQSFSGIPDTLAAAMVEAKAVLARTGDAQRADIILDKAFYQEFLDTSRVVGSAFLTGYVQLSIDSANLRTAVRAGRMSMGDDLLAQVLIDGGNISAYAIGEAIRRGQSLGSLYMSSPLSQAAQTGDEVMAGGSLTAFERQCDNALAAYLKQAKYVSFGEQPVIAYIGAVEAEINTVRIVLSGRACQLPPATIRERLRDSYV